MKVTKKEFIDFQLKDFLERKGLLLDGALKVNDISIEVLGELAGEFMDWLYVHGEGYLGLDGYLLHIGACLTLKCYEATKELKLDEVKDSEEVKRLGMERDYFNSYTKHYLGFKYQNGGYVEINGEEETKTPSQMTP